MNVTQKSYSLFFIALLAFIPFVAIEFPRVIAFIPGVIGLIFTLLYRPVFGEWPKFLKSPFIIAGSIIALSLLSYFWAIAPDITLERTWKLAAIMLPSMLLPVLALNVKSAYIKPYLAFFVLFIVAAFCLLALELEFDLPIHRFTRADHDQSLINASVLNRGTVTVILFLFSVSFFLKHIISSPIAPYLTYTLLGGLVFWVIGMSDSQSAQLALLLGVIAYVIAPYAPRFLWIIAGVLIVSLIFAAPFVMPWVFDHFVGDIESMPFLGGDDGYAGPRLEIWDFVSRYAQNSPIYGYGLEATRTITDFDTQKIYHADASILHPHNFALQLWMEFGVFGALAGSVFCSYILKVIYSMGKTESRSVALATFIAALSISAMAYGMWQSWWIGLLIAVASLCLLVHRVEQDQ